MERKKLLSAVAMALIIFAGLTFLLDGVTVKSSYRSQLQSSMSLLTDQLQYTDYYADIAGALGAETIKTQMNFSRLVVNAVKSGGLSMMEIFRGLISVINIVSKLGSLENSYGYSFDFEALGDDYALLILAAVLLLLLILGAIIAMVFAIWKLYQGKRNGGIPMLFVMMIALLISVAIVAWANGLDAYEKPFVITAWPVVGVLLAIMGVVLPRISAGERDTKVWKVWIRVCPNCGKQYETEGSFCGACGVRLVTREIPAEAPATVQSYCPDCGAEVRAGQRFCGKCGRKI